jgi:hypothetical protein
MSCPARVSRNRTTRRSSVERTRRTRPLLVSRSVIRVPVEGLTCNSSAMSTLRREPRTASTTSARNCGRVTSASTAVSARTVSPTKARLASINA